MNIISKTVWKLSSQARRKRAEFFRRKFDITGATKILDLGSEDGTNIFNVLSGSNAAPQNIFIADINKEFIAEGQRKYGYNPVFIGENGGGG